MLRLNENITETLSIQSIHPSIKLYVKRSHFNNNNKKKNNEPVALFKHNYNWKTYYN